MNINELEELAKKWSEYDPEEYLADVLELIAAYREAISALRELADADDYTEIEPRLKQVIAPSLITAKRLGIEW